MTPKQREALRLDVVRWIQSKDFDNYIAELHMTLGMLSLGLLACVLLPWKINPAVVIRGVRNRGLATGSVRRRYRELAEKGQVVLADTWMANAGLVRGEIACAPALLIAGADGTPEAETHVHSVTQMLVDLSKRPPATPEERAIQAMLDDTKYHVFRVRTLPLTFSENYPVHLFDTMLHSSAVAGGNLREMMMTVCMVHPHMRPGILPIPISIASRHMRS